LPVPNSYNQESRNELFMNDFVWLVVCVVLLVVVAGLWTRRRGDADRARAATLVADAGGAEALDRARVERERRRSDEILERIGEGVLLLDSDLRPTFANSAARDMLGFQEGGLPPRIPSEEVLAAARRALDVGDIQEVLNVWFPLPMNLRVQATLLVNGGGVLVLLRDVTQEVLAQRVRTEFVAHASHELKSPVAGLQALAEAVREATRDDPQAAARFSTQLVGEADRLGRLISDLLDLSRLEDPAGVPSQPADLSAVALREAEAIGGSARGKGIELASNVASGVVVRGDEEQLGLMVRNLLENAVRYTPNDGKVTLAVFVEGGTAYVRVSDNGIGIPLEAHGRVFERFYRVDRARSRARGGTGLGLAIVKHVVELHRGQVTLQSELGEGSTFTARFPALVDQRPQQTPVQPMAG
jgi:signal transduction histidine kinase